MTQQKNPVIVEIIVKGIVALIDVLLKDRRERRAARAAAGPTDSTAAPEQLPTGAPGAGG